MRISSIVAGRRFVHPADFPEIAKAVYHAIQTGTSYEGVIRLRRADGEFRWHHARCEPLRDRQGQIIQWYGLSVDIDEAQLQAIPRSTRRGPATQRSEALIFVNTRNPTYLGFRKIIPCFSTTKLSRLLHHSRCHNGRPRRRTQSGQDVCAERTLTKRTSHIGVAAYNETAILYGSEETYRIWGFDPAHAVPSREAAFQRIHPDDRVVAGCMARCSARMGEKNVTRLEYRIRTARWNGKTPRIKSAHPSSPQAGNLSRLSVHSIDVTERKRAEEEHERLRQLESDLAHMNRLSMMGELAASLAHEITQPIASRAQQRPCGPQFSG